VGFPVPGEVGWGFWSAGRSPQTTAQPVSPLSAWAGAAAAQPSVSTSTAITAATPRGTEEHRIMVTFAVGARHPSAAN
jgi:DNA gyrase inhibitor GyrI